MLQFTVRFEDGADDQIEAIIGTEILWKSKSRNITRKKVRKVQKHRETGAMRTVYAYKQRESFFNVFKSEEAVACTNPKCTRHKGQYEQAKLEYAAMSPYRQEKKREEQDQITHNLSTANNVALILHDIYTQEAVESYLGYWKPDKDFDGESEEEEDEWESEDEEDEPQKVTKSSAKGKQSQKQAKGKDGGSEADGSDDDDSWADSESSSGEDTADPAKAKKLLYKKLEEKTSQLMKHLQNAKPPSPDTNQ